MKNKISFCTVSMNRLHHLSQTLPKNIQDNITYGKVEFVVLNYNSNDLIDEWIFNKMSTYIQNGVLKYFKTEKPKYFDRSHAKNMAARCATGDIICNLDADNFTGPNFAEYINHIFKGNNNIYLSVDKNSAFRDLFGRIVTKAIDFHRVTGYDETMNGYGAEDRDIENRLDALGVKAIFIGKQEFLKAIQHDNQERLSEEKYPQLLKTLMVCNISYYKSILLFLFHDYSFCFGSLIDNSGINSSHIHNLFKKDKDDFGFSIEGNEWKRGNWNISKNILSIVSYEGENYIFQRDEIKANVWREMSLEKDNRLYYVVENREKLKDGIMFFSQINNRNIMIQNKLRRKIAVNSNSYGKGKVLKNLKDELYLN